MLELIGAQNGVHKTVPGTNCVKYFFDAMMQEAKCFTPSHSELAERADRC
jgi:hypothetical protein